MEERKYKLQQAASGMQDTQGSTWINARNLAKKNTDKMYILFEQRMQVQETCHMTPFKAVQKPADQDEVVNVKIEPMKKGKKPKE